MSPLHCSGPDYTPLDTQKNEIRLLYLQPHNANEDSTSEICCTFEHVSLNEQPKFEALSYVWGAQATPCNVLVGHSRIAVTKNLFTALYYLRKYDAVRVLWVDALCINQDDAQEKTIQVHNMRHIYRNATRVIVFLREELDDMDETIEFIESIANDSKLHFETSRLPHFVPKAPDPGNIELRNRFVRFLYVPWWSRLWIIQEFCLAKQIVFQCGWRSLSADVLRRCFSNILAHNSSCCAASSVVRTVEYAPGKTGSLVVGVERAAALFVTRQRLHQNLEKTSFPLIVASFRTRKTSNPRDKIYGLLGLAGAKPEEWSMPTYDRSQEMVFEKFASEAVSITGSWDILSFKCGDNSRLPSFVPDWNCTISDERYLNLAIRYDCLRFYNTSGGSRARVTKHGLGSIITQAHAWDILKSVHVCDKASVRTRFLQWRVAATSDSDFRTNGPYSSRKEAFWKSTCGAIIPWKSKIGMRYHVIDDADHIRYQSWEAWVEAGHRRPTPDVEDFHVAWSAVTADRTFVLTEKGYMGFAPVTSRPGDHVLLLPGGKVPYIMRECLCEPFIDDPAGYELVGDAYIHGIMQGEASDGSQLRLVHLY